ncbi:MAG TPA: peptidylprolyl isomerase, partial [Chitinophagaceae bacterium]|nr:peptidylprolyl isomerase [Chitinophagaceae bacterium]
MMLNTKRIFSAFILILLMTSAVQAQPKKAVADKIIGIVGDRIILLSEIKNSIADLVRQGQTIPENGECLLMEQAIISKVLMLQAMKDSLPVTDEDVEADLD